jgi:hypothetical protein
MKQKVKLTIVSGNRRDSMYARVSCHFHMPLMYRLMCLTACCFCQIAACMKEPINSNVLEEIIVSKDLGSRGQVPMTIPAGSTLTYRCKDNYKLSGEKSRVCHKNGTFSSKIPTCKRKS